MRRLLIVLVSAMAFAMVSGCFSRSTEPVQKTEGGSNFDRLKGNVKGGGNPKEARK